MNFKIRFYQMLSPILNKINSLLFRIPPPPDFVPESKEEENEFYLNIAQKRLPHIFVEEVEVLGFFFYDNESLEKFKIFFNGKKLNEFPFNKGGFNPHKDYACVIRATSGKDIFIIVEVQYYDFEKEEEMVFCKKMEEMK